MKPCRVFQAEEIVREKAQRAGRSLVYSGKGEETDLVRTE